MEAICWQNANRTCWRTHIVKERKFNYQKSTIQGVHLAIFKWWRCLHNDQVNAWRTSSFAILKCRDKEFAELECVFSSKLEGSPSAGKDIALAYYLKTSKRSFFAQRWGKVV